MLEVLALLVGIAIPVTALTMVVRRGKRHLDASIAYGQVARNLGLNVDTRGLCVQGHLGDRRLWVGEVLMGHGTERETAIWGVVDLQGSLSLGLHVRHRGLSERVFRRRNAPGVELGDERLDRQVEIRGDDAVRIRALMGDRDVKAALFELMARWPDVVVTDFAVRVYLKRPETTERGLQTLVDRMLTLASALETARRHVEVPERLEPLTHGWSALAQRMGLRHEPWLPAVVGERDGRRIRLTTWRSDRGYQADLRVYFADHRETGIRIRPQVEPDGYWSVGQDIQLGDPEFDSAFVLKGYDPRRIADMMDARTRNAAHALSAIGHLQVDDARIHVRDLPFDDRRLQDAIERALELADALGW